MARRSPSRRRPKRVLLLHDYGGDRGGAEQIALDFRRLLRERGIDARLMASDADPWDDTSAPDIVAKGGKGAFHTLREAWNPGAGRRLARTLEDFRPDIVQIVMFLSQLSPAILSHLQNVPTLYAINTYRAVCPTGLRWRPGAGICTRDTGAGCMAMGCVTPLGLLPRLTQLAVLRRGSSAIDKTVVPSNIMAAILKRHNWPVTDIVPHAVPPHQRRREMSASKTLAFAGRLVPEKGVDWLLQAFARVAPDIPGAALQIIGDGPDRPRLEAITKKLGLVEQIEFTGHLAREESQKLLEIAWVQAVPSLWAEPFGLVAAEALARGTPVIASDAGGPAEIVDHGSTGWIVNTGCDVGLAEAILEALDSRERNQTMGRRGAKVAAERYDEGVWIERYIELYCELLDDHAARGAP